MQLRTVMLCTTAILLHSAIASAAQSIDIDALKKKIEARSSQYSELVTILENEKVDTALAAFDVMVETGDKTLIEMAVSSALSATDTRLRARALWEAMSRRRNFVIEVDTDALAEQEEGLQAVRSWFGEQRTFPITNVFADTQCLNLVSRNSCYADGNATISGVKLDIVRGDWLSGSFELATDGNLRGTIANPDENSPGYPARIVFR